MEKQQNKPKRGRPRKAKQIPPAPAWLDEPLRKEVENMDAAERSALADKYESEAKAISSKAEQLRGFAPLETKVSVEIKTWVTPTMKEALLFYSNLWDNAGREEESAKLACAVRWVLEASLPMMDKLVVRTERFIEYRTAEDIPNSVLSDAQIRKALDALKRIQADTAGGCDCDD